MDTLLVVLCTFPDTATARQLGTDLIERQLAACVNLLPGAESIYRWQGRTGSSSEVLAIFKTTDVRYPAFAAALAAGHPYEVPEIVALRPETVAESYLAWAAAACDPTPIPPPE
jgi:periplasmic divalent cation tolerance protein